MTYYLLGQWIVMRPRERNRNTREHGREEFPETLQRKILLHHTQIYHEERKSKIWEASFKKLSESLTKNLEEGFLA